MWAFCAASTILIIPRMGRSWPVRESSPTKSLFAVSEARSCLLRVKMARAIGKSRYVPFFCSSAGARLIMTLSDGKLKEELVMAE